MNQGDIYWYTFRAPDKRRPVLILTRNSAIRYLSAVTVAPVTATIRGIPSEVVVTAADGMLNDSAINCDNIQTVPKANLSRFMTQLSAAKMREVRTALEFALGFDGIT